MDHNPLRNIVTLLLDYVVCTMFYSIQIKRNLLLNRRKPQKSLDEKKKRSNRSSLTLKTKKKTKSKTNYISKEGSYNGLYKILICKFRTLYPVKPNGQEESRRDCS